MSFNKIKFESAALVKANKNIHRQKKVAVITAHPDDEILWAGGIILIHVDDWDVFIMSLCRANDQDRAPKFYKTLKILDAKGTMGDLDDGPEQKPLTENVVNQLILKLLPIEHFDLIITHSPLGEYTKHLRHEEIGKSVINLWNEGRISTDSLWVFAYEDGKKAYFPRPIENADIFIPLPRDIWLKKYALITQTYNFKPTTWEAQTTPNAEAFWQFTEAEKAKEWLENILINKKNNT